MTGYIVCGMALGYVDTVVVWSQYYLDLLWYVGRDSSVGIATCYGLGGPGIESRWARDLLLPSSPTLGFT